MKDYFENQAHLDGIMFMTEVYTTDSETGNQLVRLEILKATKDEIPSIAETYEFVKMSGANIPVLKKKD